MSSKRGREGKCDFAAPREEGKRFWQGGAFGNERRWIAGKGRPVCPPGPEEKKVRLNTGEGPSRRQNDERRCGSHCTMSEEGI